MTPWTLGLSVTSSTDTWNGIKTTYKNIDHVTNNNIGSWARYSVGVSIMVSPNRDTNQELPSYIGSEAARTHLNSSSTKSKPCVLINFPDKTRSLAWTYPASPSVPAACNGARAEPDKLQVRIFKQPGNPMLYHAIWMISPRSGCHSNARR